ncbi:hypothetical protein [Bacillus amyloliquefaciens]|uniref:hypothetical protein n=1 Tax=Bacillus amyloliquefaciens TaxID=1390 RepID=UPI0032DF092C
MTKNIKLGSIVQKWEDGKLNGFYIVSLIPLGDVLRDKFGLVSFEGECGDYGYFDSLEQIASFIEQEPCLKVALSDLKSLSVALHPNQSEAPNEKFEKLIDGLSRRYFLSTNDFLKDPTVNGPFYILEESFTKEHIIELMKKHIEIIKSYEIAHTRVIPHQFAVLKSFISDLNHKLAVAEEKLKQLQDREGER